MELDRPRSALERCLCKQAFEVGDWAIIPDCREGLTSFSRTHVLQFS